MEKAVIRRISYFYYGIILLSLAVVTLLIFLAKKGQLAYLDPLSSAGQVFQTIVICYIIASLPCAMFGFKKYCDKLKAVSDREQQLKSYFKASAIRIIIVGTGIIFGILAFYLLGGHRPMIWCAAIAAIGLIFCKPQDSRLRLELEDNQQPKQ